MNGAERGRSGSKGWDTSALILSAVLTALGAPAPTSATDASQTATKAPPNSAPHPVGRVSISRDHGGAAPVNRSETLQGVSGIVGPGYDLNPPSNERAGVTFGATVGYNFQHGPIVYGGETELNFLDGRRAPAGTFLAPPAYAAMGVGSPSRWTRAAIILRACAGASAWLMGALCLM